LGLAFFGLTPEHRVGIFTQIHEIVYHGNGGYDWETVYNMPLWLRKFTFRKIQDWFDKQNAEIEKQKNKMTNTTKAEIARPAIQPDYSYKASQK
jgi:hypothetical protein